MASAVIRSEITSRVAPGDPKIGVSRDDLLAGDVVQLTSNSVGTSYAWSLAYVPEGSAAAFSGSSVAVSPGTFTVDREGPYLIRLVFTDGTGTSEQFVRLRALTVFGSLKLVSAGERVDTVPVPVDITITGWADTQNYNLLTLLSLIEVATSSGRVVYVDPSAGDYQSIQDAMDYAQTQSPSAASPWVVLPRPGLYIEDLTFYPHVHVFGWPGGQDTSIVKIRNATTASHTAVLTLVGSELCLSNLYFEMLGATSNPLLSVSGAGTLTTNKCALVSAGAGAPQGPALSIGTSSVWVSNDSRFSSTSVASAASYALRIGTSSTATVRRSRILERGLQILAGATVSLVDTDILTAGSYGVDSAGDLLNLDYCTVSGASVQDLAFNPTGAAVVGNVRARIRWSRVGDVLFDNTGVTGTSELIIGSSETGTQTFPGGALTTLSASTPSSTIFYDNTSSGLTAENVQEAIDEIYTFSSAVRTLDDAYDGGDPGPTGSGRTIVADAGAVRIVDASSPSDPIPASNTNGNLEVVGSIKTGALNKPEQTFDPNPYGNGPFILMGREIWANDAVRGSTAFVLADSTGAPSYHNYNLRVGTKSADGGGSVGNVLLRGGDSLLNPVQAASVYVQAGRGAGLVGGNGGSVWIAPGDSAAGTGGSLFIARPESGTQAMVTAANLFVGGVAGTIRFATDMGAVSITVAAPDNIATVIATIDATNILTGQNVAGKLRVLTKSTGATSEVFFLQATAGLDAALGTFSGEVMVQGTWPLFVEIQVSAANEITFGPNAAFPMIYNGDTGKLTVPGPIDPTAIIFEEAPAPSTGATEGALFVSDGSGGLTIHHLYFRSFSDAVPQDLSSGNTLANVLAAGNVTGGTNIVVTSTDKITGESSAGVGGNLILQAGSDTGAGPTAGGNVQLRPGAGVGGGAEGAILIVNSGATNSVSFTVTGAEEITIGTTLPMVYNGTTGKLTVPGIIDPTAVVFTADGPPSTGASEGSIFVSDGSSSLQAGSLYYGGPSNATAVDITTYAPYVAGFAGYSVAPSVQDAASDASTMGPVLYGATAGRAGGPYWARTPDGTHPIRTKLRRGMLNGSTDFCGPGWWVPGDGKVFLAFIPGVGYQVAFAAATADLPFLTGSPVSTVEWPWEEANGNGDVVTFRVSVNGVRWVTLFSVDLSLPPYSTTAGNFSGIFIQGTGEVLIERTYVQ